MANIAKKSWTMELNHTKPRLNIDLIQTTKPEKEKPSNKEQAYK